MNRIDICKNIIQSIKEYITTPEKLEPHRAKNHFIRKRKLSLFQVIMYLLYTSKASMFQNLSRIREDLGSLDFPDISKQALSKARQFINPDLFKEFYYLSVDLFYKQFPSRKLWNGYHLFAIDGSKIELPNSKSNFEFFGEMFGYPDPSRRFTMGLGSIVYDVLDDYIVHASFQRYLASERSAALEHLHNLEDLNIYQNSVVIFDRGYYSEDMFRYQANRAFIIGRVKTIVPKILSNLFDLSVLDILYKESLRCRSQIMPGRTFRRKKNKAIGRTHFNNKKVAF